MVDGTAILMTMFWGMSPDRACGTTSTRGTNLLDTGAHFYDVYECADGKYISLGSIEPQFYAELLAPHRARPTTRSSPSRWTRRSGRR